MTRVYDLVMTHKLDADDFFIHRVQQHCAERGLNFFLVEPLWVESFLAAWQRNAVWARVLLNMHSEHHLPDEIYHRLIRYAHQHGCQVIDPPDVALAAFDKAALHGRLIEAGLPVPPTIVVKREQVGAFKLGAAEREMLGSPFVVKPGMGYGRRGVVLDATSEADVARSVGQWSDRHYLLQKRIVPRVNGTEPVYFRVYHVFGEIWICWWNCHNDNYRVMTPEEETVYGAEALRELVRRVAKLTGMQFFSSEIAQTETGELVLIDYVNDQCHLLTQTASPGNGVPDALVAAIAQKLVASAHRLIQTRTGHA